MATPPTTLVDFRTIARARLLDAKALLKANRYDGGMYLCGYAVELALKARICKTLKWTAFPPKKGYDSFYVHDLDVLLNLSGREQAIKTKLFAQWSAVAAWDPAVRYAAMTATASELELMIESTEMLLKKLL